MSIPNRATAARMAWTAFAAVAWLAGLGTTVHAAETPIGATTVGGKLFLDTTHLNQYKNGKRTDISRDGADLTRFYIDIDHRFSQVWSAHLTTDINWLRDDSPTDLWFKRAICRVLSARR